MKFKVTYSGLEGSEEIEADHYNVLENGTWFQFWEQLRGAVATIRCNRVERIDVVK